MKKELFTEKSETTQKLTDKPEARIDFPSAAASELDEINRKMWKVFFVMKEGVCLNEIIRDDAGRAIDYKIIKCNPAYESILRLNGDRAIGRYASELYGLGKSPDLEFYSKLTESGESVGFNSLFATTNRHFQVSAFPFQTDRFIAVFSEIATSKQGKKLPIETERKVRALLDQTSHFIWLLKPDGTLIDVNRSALELGGIDSSAVLGQPFWETPWWSNNQEQQDRMRDWVNRASAGEVVAIEAQQPGSDGQVRYIEGSLKPVKDETGKVVVILPEGRDITEQKHFERKLLQSEEFLTDVIESIQDGISVMDSDLTIRRVNKVMRHWYADNTPLEGKKCYQSYHNRSQPCVSCPSIRSLESGQKEHEIVPGFPGSTIEWIEHFSYPIKDRNSGEIKGVVEFIRDLTESRRVEKELMKLALAINYCGELVNMATLDGMMVFLNHAGARMLGIDQNEVNQIHIMEVIPEHFKDLVTNELLPALIEGGTWEGELQYKNLKTGKLVDVQAMTYTVPDPTTGKPLFLANVSMDITERKRAEREHKALESHVQHMQKLESLGVLAGGIAHDFNNILMGILGNAEIALNRIPGNSVIRNNLDGIFKSALRAADLCQQMLAYSGKGKFIVEVLDLREIVKGMAHILEVSISKKASYSCKFMDDIPFVEGDATQIRQIILNLITNASESLEENSGTISLNIGNMECDQEYLVDSFIDDELPSGTYVFLDISDDGKGMDEQTISKMFDPFFTTKFTGRGLGLSAVQGIIRGHKGSVKVTSKPGKGTCVRVLLPAARNQSVKRTELQPTSEFWWAGGTILLVDDDEVIRTVVSDMLLECGLNVLTASNGSEALKTFKNYKDNIDLVLLDLTMPVMDGEETFREMQRIKEDVCVILSSGYNEQEISQRFVGKGLAGFIQKPYKLDAILSKLEKLMTIQQS